MVRVNLNKLLLRYSMNRPPFTPSNSLLLSPPFTRITISEKAEAKSEANSEKQKSTVSVSNYLSTVCSAYIQYKNSQRRHSTAVLKTLPELCGNGKQRLVRYFKCLLKIRRSLLKAKFTAHIIGGNYSLQNSIDIQSSPKYR